MGVTRHAVLGALLSLLICLAAVAASPATPTRSLLERAQEIREHLASQRGDTPAERVKTALRLGTLTENDADLEAIARTDPRLALQARAKLYLQTYRFADARAAIEALQRMPGDAESEWLLFRWLLLTENLRAVDSLSRTTLEQDSTNVPAWLGRGELLYRLLRFDEAKGPFLRAYALAGNAEWRARAVLGLGRVAFREDHYQESADTLTALFDIATLDDAVLVNLSLTLISLGRVTEAIDLAEEAVRWNPWSEYGQYYLGNGYARLSYSQLEKKYASEMADAAMLRALDLAKAALTRGRLDSARAMATDLLQRYPKSAPAFAFLGSVWWTQAQFDSAAVYFRSALDIVPEYGRARNGLAKALEGLRMQQNVHRAEDSAAFAARPMPSIPAIETFVVNWTSLSPRHQKQVAVSMDLWKAYLPVLIECGSRNYIKPLYEKLSEAPELASIRDQRVSYDSRLWDDVRGCGGFITVTGIEDVERTIYASYNTVLHELTHQVHGVFPPTDWQRIEDTFHRAREREDAGTRTFMSRYQQASVWEYFAEGANAYGSPQRDEYDTRDVVRERLFARDTALVNLVEYYATAPNLDVCYPVGLVNAAEHALETQNTERALTFAERARSREPRAQAVLSELSRVHSILDHDSLAMCFADTLVTVYPRTAGSFDQKADASFFTDGDAAAAVRILETGLNSVDSSEKKDIRQSLGGKLWYAGRYAEAAAQFEAVLSEVRDDPDALWGLGLARGDAGDFIGADSAFQEAVRRRSGVVELRLDYARILLMSGRTDEASRQIEEAQLLAPGDPDVITMKGWLIAERGLWKRALMLYDRAVKEAPDQRLAAVLRVKALQHKWRKRTTAKSEATRLLKCEQTDVPTWVFRSRTAEYVPGRVWPQFQRDLLHRYTDTR